MEALDQRLRLRVGVGIERLMRMRVAAQEVSEPKHVAVIGAADDHRSTGSALKQADPSEDQGAHDPLAEFGLGDKQGTQPVRRDDECAGRFAGIRVDETGPPRQLRQLAEERSGPLGRR